MFLIELRSKYVFVYLFYFNNNYSKNKCLIYYNFIIKNVNDDFMSVTFIFSNNKE